MNTDDNNRIVAQGAWGNVEYAVRSNGRKEARDWLENEGVEEQASFDVLFRKMAGAGRINNKEQFRKLRDEIFEFKRRGHRILCFRIENRWLLTHHYAKGGKKCPASEIVRAEAIRNEHIEWESRR